MRLLTRNISLIAHLRSYSFDCGDVKDTDEFIFDSYDGMDIDDFIFGSMDYHISER